MGLTPLELCDTPTDAIYDAAVEAVSHHAEVPSWLIIIAVNAALVALQEEASK